MTCILAVLVLRCRLVVTPAFFAPALNTATIAQVVARDRQLAAFVTPLPLLGSNVPGFGHLKSSDPSSLSTSGSPATHSPPAREPE
jgi:hypothetical protein